MMTFQYIEPYSFDNEGWIHQDKSQFGGIIYLTKEPEVGTGTSLYKPKRGWFNTYSYNIDVLTKNYRDDKFDKDDCFYGDDFIRIAYVKSFKNNDVDNRTYKQVDSIEAYIRYKLLKNPFLYICDVNIFTDHKMGFDLDSLAEEINVPKRNLIYRCEDEFKIPPYEQK